ncbi:MAG: efflux RND transporter periplasmic adaptor subunit [Tsuneonella suprasediminis]|nr:efflux RND transporter periplasmic adaptor subunit [Altererythrobacter sp. N1]
MFRSLLCSAALAGIVVTLSGCSETSNEAATAPAGSDPYAALQIATTKAKVVTDIPLGSVPGTITLPPEARVAVSSPFPGAAIRVYVIEGEEVRRGQALALVRSAEPVQFRGDLARAQSEAGLAKARAERLGQLAKEGIIAQARADEAFAALSQAQASLAEQRRLVALAGAGRDGTMTLTAPISGRVSHVGVDTGGPVDGLTAPFVIEANGRYQVDLQLPERLAHQVEPGMAIEVQFVDSGAGKPLKVGGQILAVSPSIDPATRSVMARASIGAAPGIVAGRNVMVTIKAPSGRAGVAIPESAITRIGTDDYVFVRVGNTYKATKVEVVARTGGDAIVSVGLKPGDIVATSSVAELKAKSAE